ncbi:MAG: hypothetical protein HYZ75_15135 [Elusimicrobia bacterium]|nr:hypothetical protein [Elusimicrobiota bacterium]
MRVALDAPAGAGLAALAAGAVRAAGEGVEVELFGPAETLRSELARAGAGGAPGLTVTDAPSASAADEDPAAACREKPESSLMRAAEAVAQKRCQALVTAASPASAAAASLWHLKRLRGVLRPALALPLRRAGRTTLLVDAGACLECKPWHLLQFALMGSMHARLVGGVSDPSVRLLAAGQGAQLGPELQRETVPLLKYAGVRFEGTISSEEVFRGLADVVVCDGLSGAALAGAARSLPALEFEMLSSDLSEKALSRLAGRLGGAALARAKSRARGLAAASAALLGVGGAVAVCAQPSDPEAAAEAIAAAGRLAESGLGAEIQKRLEDMKSGMEFAKTIE